MPPKPHRIDSKVAVIAETRDLLLICGVGGVMVICRSGHRLQSVFSGRYRDFRVFLAAAMLTLESFWGRVVLACYTGGGVRTRDRIVVAVMCISSSGTDNLDHVPPLTPVLS
ncbi:hypothetical protein PoB_001044000 [Plakobranchus ocellatus]|uniref:Uncharacterized protein n=1 Tax=Plakobranchus ocellatus TaxID=259542 RepID=A0AAV3YN88_9GAST|nr:hypothetical protein PoB_001044000 [Plakobranchus ocellatus]